MNRLRSCAAWLLLATLLLSFTAQADGMLMRRIQMTFPETMTALQNAITEGDFKVARVQRVDIGLTASGYDTAEYRIVFFMRDEEMQEVIAREPGLAAFLPLKMTLFAERGETLIVTMNPTKLGDFFPESGMQDRFRGWHREVVAILDRVQAEQ
jgi:uncharacterized protein (DUF302 family)